MDHHSSAVSAPSALKILLDGNKRFLSGQNTHKKIDQESQLVVPLMQNPFAVILTCADSQMAPEIIFDQWLGNLYVIRNAGNIIDDITLGSIEYGVTQLGIKLVLVLGHQGCDTLTNSCLGIESEGHIQSINDKIQPALEKAFSQDGDIIGYAIDANIENSVNILRTSEPLLANLWNNDQIKIGGARFDLDSGRVVFI